MRVVNLFAGPGSGKSTTAAGIFYKLKTVDFRCELITEVAKDMTYEKNASRMSNQIFLLGEQYQRLHRVRDSVNFAISDSPIILGINYRPDTYPKSYDQLCLDLFEEFENINYFVVRTKKYQQYGRNETEDQARKHDDSIRNILEKYSIPYIPIIGDTFAVDRIIEDLSDQFPTEFDFGQVAV